MKKLLIFVLVCFSFFNLKSQAYYPMGEDSSIMYFSCSHTNSPYPITHSVEQFTFVGDTFINGSRFTKVYYLERDIDTLFQTNSASLNYTYIFAIRDSAKKVFTIEKDSSKAKLIYDFGLSIGDTMFHYPHYQSTTLVYSVLIDIDSFLIRYPIQHYRKRYNYNGGIQYDPVVEGLGVDYLTFPVGPIRTSGCQLECFLEKDNYTYMSSDTCNCYKILDKHRRLSVSQTSGINKLNIHPNPFQNNITIELPEGSGEIKLVDISGKIVLSTEFENEKSIQINTAKIPSGVYIITVIREGEILRSKVIKE